MNWMKPYPEPLSALGWLRLHLDLEGMLMFMLRCGRGRGLAPLWNWWPAWLPWYPVDRGLRRHRVLHMLLHWRLKIGLMRERPWGVDRRMMMHLHVWHREWLARLLG